MRIKEILKEKGITQKQLAEKMGITPSALSQAINGKNTRNHTYNKIATALGVTVSELFTDESEHEEILAPQICDDFITLKRFFDDWDGQLSSVHFTCPHCGKDITLKISL